MKFYDTSDVEGGCSDATASAIDCCCHVRRSLHPRQKRCLDHIEAWILTYLADAAQGLQDGARRAGCGTAVLPWCTGCDKVLEPVGGGQPLEDSRIHSPLLQRRTCTCACAIAQVQLELAMASAETRFR